MDCLHWHSHRFQICYGLLRSGLEFDACNILFLNNMLSFFSERWQQCRQNWGAHVHGLFNCWTFCHHSPVGERGGRGQSCPSILFLTNILELRTGPAVIAELDAVEETVMSASLEAKAHGLQVRGQPELQRDFFLKNTEKINERSYRNCTNVMRFFSPPDSSSSRFRRGMLNILVRKSLPTSS